MSCQVQRCRFPDSHITHYHRCGKCGRYGHGKVECDLNVKPLDPKPYLQYPEINTAAYTAQNRLFALQTVPLRPENYCKVSGCPVPKTHNTASHQPDFDQYCDELGPDQYGVRRRADLGKQHTISAVSGKPGTYSASYWGMGKFIVSRNLGGTISTIQSELGPEYDNFVQGLTEIP